jgi:hypothetical protein
MFGEVDPARRRKLRDKKDESRFDGSGHGSKVSNLKLTLR